MPEENNEGYHGFIAPIIEPDHLLGGQLGARFKREKIMPGGQYLNHLPLFEFQRQYGVESMGCTGFGQFNDLEIIGIVRKYGETNWSDRFPNIVAGTTRGGNSPHTVAEFTRKIGNVHETDLPFDETINTWDKFYSPKPMTSKLLSLAKEKFLDVYDFGHEWLFKTWLSVPQKQQKIMETLEFSPVGASVYANYGVRTNSQGLIYKKQGDKDNHWVVIVGYIKGVKWFIFDTYEKAVKELVWDYNFQFCKEYYLKKKPPKYETQVPIITSEGKELPIGTVVTAKELVSSLWAFIVQKTGYVGLVFKKLGNKFKK